MKQLLASLILTLGIGSGIYATQVKATELVTTSRVWCKSFNSVVKTLTLSTEAAWNVIVEECFYSFAGNRPVTVKKCYIIPSSKYPNLVLLEVTLKGLEGPRYITRDRESLRKLLTEYAAELKCKRNIQTGG